MIKRNKNGSFAYIDRAGERHWNYVLQADTGKKDKSGSYIWMALCDCGNRFEVSASKLRSKKSCGCKNQKNSGLRNHRDLTGTVVRDIVAVQKTDKHSNGYVVWKAKCLLCGDVKEFPSYYFVRNHVSCKCESWKEKYSEEVGRKPLPNNQAHVNILFTHYRRSAEERNIPFLLEKEEFRKFIESDCYYCGAKPTVTFTAASIAGEYAWNGIDRVDNTKGYESSNCVPCCKMCNFAKGTKGKEEFLSWIRRVYEYSLSKGVMP